MKLGSKKRAKHPTETIKLCDTNNLQDEGIASSTIENKTTKAKISYLNLIKYSGYVQAEVFKNEIFSRFSTHLEETQQTLKISEGSINSFSRLLNDEEVEVKNDEFYDLLKLSDIFKVTPLFQILHQYLQNHKNDVDFLVNLKIAQEKANCVKFYENDQISIDIEKILSNNINEMLENDKVGLISISSIYRMIEESRGEEISNDLLYRFISKKIEERRILFRFIKLEKLSDEIFEDIFSKYIRDKETKQSQYFEYLPSNIEYIKQLKDQQKSLKKMIEMLERKQEEMKQKQTRENEKLKEISQQLEKQMKDKLKQKDYKIKELKSANQQKDDEIKELKSANQQKDDEIKELRSANQQSSSKIKELSNDIKLMKTKNEKQNRFSFEIIKELLKRYGDVLEFKIEGIHLYIHKNLLHYASQTGNQYLVEFLLSLNKIDINTKITSIFKQRIF